MRLTVIARYPDIGSTAPSRPFTLGGSASTCDYQGWVCSYVVMIGDVVDVVTETRVMNKLVVEG